jgi:hypothetical protein
MRDPATTLHILPALLSPRAVVLRRGPSKWWHIMLWDRATGIITPGSWFEGMLYPERCDLSPRGDLMLLVAYRGTNDPIAWTALCRPPYARALVFWPQDTAVLGGGLFDERLPVVWLNLKSDRNTPDVREETGVEFGYLDEDHRWYGGPLERMARDGWKLEPMPAGTPDEPLGPKPLRLRKASPKRRGELVLEYPHARVELQGRREVVHTGPAVYSLRRSPQAAPEPLEGVTWAGWNTKGELCAARGQELLTCDITQPALAWQVVINLAGLRPPPPRPRSAAAPSPS